MNRVESIEDAFKSVIEMAPQASASLIALKTPDGHRTLLSGKLNVDVAITLAASAVAATLSYLRDIGYKKIDLVDFLARFSGLAIELDHKARTCGGSAEPGERETQ